MCMFSKTCELLHMVMETTVISRGISCAKPRCAMTDINSNAFDKNVSTPSRQAQICLLSVTWAQTLARVANE